MEDEEIVEQLYIHEESSLTKVANKYHGLLKNVANNILRNEEDAEECVNDTYLKIWNIIPPYKPMYLKSFICKIVRQLSIDKYRKNNRKERDKKISVSLSDLDYEVSFDAKIEQNIEAKGLTQAINDFVEKLDIETKALFIRRYVLFESVKDISKRFEISESLVSVKLFRVRKSLKKYLEMEGYKIEKI